MPLSDHHVQPTPSLDFLPGSGEATALALSHDWAATSLGQIGAWPQSLKTAIGMIMLSTVPIVMLWGEDGYMIYNDAYSQIAGARHPGIFGMKVREAWPEVADFNDNVMRVGLAGGTLAYRDQELTLYRNGTPEQVWLNLDYSPVLGDNGRPAGVIAIVVETTERLRSEAALRDSEAQFRAFAQAVPNHVWAAHANGDIYWLNDQTYSYSGAAAGDLTGPSAWGNIVHADDLAIAGAHWAAALAGAHVYETEFRVRRHDGAYRWFLARAEAVRNARGGVVRWVGTNTDIHDLRETETALRRANETLEEQVAMRTAELRAKEARLRTVFETSFGFQGLIDPHGLMLDANATSLAAIGASLGDVAGMAYWETPWFANTQGMDEAMREAVMAVAAGAVVRQELLINLPVGGWRWFDFVLRPIRTVDEEVIAIVAEAIETTDRRKAEEALRQSQKLEAIGQLTGGVAHDFNNLLTPIIGSLDLLHRRELGGERERKLIEGGLQSAERAKVLVQRLLAFARRQPLQPQPVDIAALIQSMESLIGSTVGARIQVAMTIAALLPPAIAEANQLEMALLNLAVNARDAMPEGGMLTIAAEPQQIAAGARADLAAGDYVRIIVSDTGSGMDAHTRAHAIEPFFSTKGAGKGTGLGLSMAHGLMSQLGGALTISSELGRGTAIELLLPVADQVVTQPIAVASDTTVIGRSARVLLVDDDPIVRATTADMLEEIGHIVIKARSAEEAIALFDAPVDEPAIDLIVTDYRMSGMTGMDLIRRLRLKKPGLPVLVISGFADAEGIDADTPRLTKPFRSAELARMLAILMPLPG